MSAYVNCEIFGKFLNKNSEKSIFLFTSRCYRIVVIKLAKGDNKSNLPRDPTELNITSYEDVHEEGGTRGAYLAEAFDR